MLWTIIAGSLALSEHAKVIRDFSLGLIEIAGLILVLFFWTNVIQQEISQNTIFLISSKNIKRGNIILGKFFWFSAVVLLFTIVMWSLYYIISLLYHIPFSWIHLLAISSIYIKLEVLLSICLLFASFVSPFVSLVTSLVLYFLSHILGFVVYYATVLRRDLFSPALWIIVKAIYYIFPNFTSLTIQDFLDVPYLNSILLQSLWFSVIFHIMYIVVLLFFTIRIFNKKQF